MHTIVSGDGAQTHMVKAGQAGDQTDAIAADAVLLPNPFWGPFEARRRAAEERGSRIARFRYSAARHRSRSRSATPRTEQIQTVARLVGTQRTHVTFAMPERAASTRTSGATRRAVCCASRIPAQSLDVVREDIASVAARRVTISRANDEAVKIPANGFSLAGTLSKPASTKRQHAAGRDSGRRLRADRSRRDAVQHPDLRPARRRASPTRATSCCATTSAASDRAAAAPNRRRSPTTPTICARSCSSCSERKDVDQKRIAVLGHSEGGSVAMLAAAKDKHITAVVLVAAIGVTGAELNMEQVTHGLDRLKKTDRRASDDARPAEADSDGRADRQRLGDHSARAIANRRIRRGFRASSRSIRRR